MPSKKRSTIYFESEIFRALKLKAAVSEASISDIVDKAVRRELAEDEADLSAFKERAKEPSVSFESVLKDLKAKGKI